MADDPQLAALQAQKLQIENQLQQAKTQTGMYAPLPGQQPEYYTSRSRDIQASINQLNYLSSNLTSQISAYQKKPAIQRAAETWNAYPESSPQAQAARAELAGYGISPPDVKDVVSGQGSMYAQMDLSRKYGAEIANIAAGLRWTEAASRWSGNLPTQTGGSQTTVSKYRNEAGQAWTVAPGEVGSFGQKGVIEGTRPTIKMPGGIDTGIPLTSGYAETARASSFAAVDPITGEKTGGAIFYGPGSTSNMFNLQRDINPLISAFAPGTTPGNVAKYGSSKWYQNEIFMREMQGKTSGDFTSLTGRAKGAAYVPLGEYRQQEIKDISSITKTEGRLEIRVNRYDPYGNIIGEQLIGGAGAGWKESGMFSFGRAMTPAVFAQYNPTKAAEGFGGMTGKTSAADVMARPELYSRLGAEAYGGIVQPLNPEKFGVTRETLVGVYPGNRFNLSNEGFPSAGAAPKDAGTLGLPAPFRSKTETPSTSETVYRPSELTLKYLSFYGGVPYFGEPIVRLTEFVSPGSFETTTKGTPYISPENPDLIITPYTITSRPQMTGYEAVQSEASAKIFSALPPAMKPMLKWGTIQFEKAAITPEDVTLGNILTRPENVLFKSTVVPYGGVAMGWMKEAPEKPIKTIVLTAAGFAFAAGFRGTESVTNIGAGIAAKTYPRLTTALTGLNINVLPKVLGTLYVADVALIRGTQGFTEFRPGQYMTTVGGIYGTETLPMMGGGSLFTTVFKPSPVQKATMFEQARRVEPASPIDTGFKMSARDYALASKLGEGEITLEQFNRWVSKPGTQIFTETGGVKTFDLRGTAPSTGFETTGLLAAGEGATPASTYRGIFTPAPTPGLMGAGAPPPSVLKIMEPLPGGKMTELYGGVPVYGSVETRALWRTQTYPKENYPMGGEVGYFLDLSMAKGVKPKFGVAPDTWVVTKSSIKFPVSETKPLDWSGRQVTVQKEIPTFTFPTQETIAWNEAMFKVARQPRTAMGQEGGFRLFEDLTTYEQMMVKQRDLVLPSGQYGRTVYPELPALLARRELTGGEYLRLYSGQGLDFTRLTGATPAQRNVPSYAMMQELEGATTGRTRREYALSTSILPGRGIGTTPTLTTREEPRYERIATTIPTLTPMLWRETPPTTRQTPWTITTTTPKMPPTTVPRIPFMDIPFIPPVWSWPAGIDTGRGGGRRSKFPFREVINMRSLFGGVGRVISKKKKSTKRRK